MQRSHAPMPNRVSNEDSPAVELSAVIVGAAHGEPQVLVVCPKSSDLEALPSGPLESTHRTLEAGLRSWVEQQTSQPLGYVEQLYTFGDRDRTGVLAKSPRPLSIGYLALARELRESSDGSTAWRSWYRYFPWEDWRTGKPAVLAKVEAELKRWIAGSAPERRTREERARAAFALGGGTWSEERALERYELLYEMGLVEEALRDRKRSGEPPLPGQGMFSDHRRMLATAIARLRGKIKYRPVVFELMPPTFTFLQLQRTVEGLSGLTLHKPNFRRVVESQGLVEETGEVASEGTGRPARLLRYRRELIDRPVQRLPVARPVRRPAGK
jgi:hypothetical protein